MFIKLFISKVKFLFYKIIFAQLFINKIKFIYIKIISIFKSKFKFSTFNRNNFIINKIIINLFFYCIL